MASSEGSTPPAGEKGSEVHSGGSTHQSESDSSPRSVHGWRWAAAVASLYIGALIYGLDGTIAADIQLAIIEQYGEVEKLTWIGTAFPLGSVCAILPGYVCLPSLPSPRFPAPRVC